MAAERLSMRQIREVLRQKWGLGLSHRAVARDAARGMGGVEEARGRELKGSRSRNRTFAPKLQQEG